MKQNITPKQVEELSEKANKKLIKWLKKNDYYYLYATSEGRILSIGQMIEFLIDNRYYIILEQEDLNYKWVLTQNFVEGGYYENKELCDVLWEAVKEILEI